jgi:Ca-activated chloride channel homolog
MSRDTISSTEASSKRPLLYCSILTLSALLIVSTLYAQTPEEQVNMVSRYPVIHHTDDRLTLKANSDLVLVNVTVTDPEGRNVSDLNATQFSLLDNKRSQPISYFSCEDAPVSLAVVLDTSSSMEERFGDVRSAALEFFQAANVKDEFTVISFADQPHVVARFDDPISDFQPILASLQPEGHTALWDAIYLAIQQLGNARYTKKALLLISDGGDNHSRYTESEIKSVLREADVQLYAIDFYKRYPKTTEEKSGLLWLDEVAGVSGGRTFLTINKAELHHAVQEISLELRNQYVLGFSPPTTGRDGKWHKIKIGLSAANRKKLRVYAKQGYYSPSE